MRVLILDNGDPCLAHLLEPLRDLGAECDVRPSGSLGLQDIHEMTPQPQRILMTPGPGQPEETGVCPEVVSFIAGLIPILGVGLGLQALAHTAQGRLISPNEPRNPAAGRTTIRHDGKNLFAGLPSPFDAPRDPNLSLVLDAQKLANDLEVSAWDEDGNVVGCRVWALGMEAIQIDTRWFATRLGNDMLFNFLFQSQAW